MLKIKQHSPSFDLIGMGLLQTAFIMSVCVGRGGGEELVNCLFRFRTFPAVWCVLQFYVIVL